jgi:6-phosphogluconolactonase/glucosamine-6-phosphate isomerase/deaminase
VAAAVEVSEEVPASVVRRHPKGNFFLDEDAGSDLGGGLADD